MAAGIQTGAALWRFRDTIETLRTAEGGGVFRNSAVRRVISVCLALALVSATLAGCKPSGPSSAVVGPGNVSLTLAWNAPAEDAAGAPLGDLAGFHLYYSRNTPVVRETASVIEVNDASADRFTVTGLESGVYFFAVSARDASGNESALSDELRVEVPSS